MIHKILPVFIFIFTIMPTAHAQEIPPHGWSIQYSQNSLYLTRPDLPNIRVAVVSDVREELSQDEKFDHVKTFFAERADCPSLAKAETTKSMGGFSAKSEGVSARCKLISMGHWVKGGLQSALIMNEGVKEDKLLGGVPTRKTIADDGYTAKAIHQDIVQFLMTRYQIAQSKMPIDKVKAQITAEGLAGLYPSTHKPEYLVRLTSDDGYDAITDARLSGAYALALFPKRDKDAYASAHACMQWDPKLFSPYISETPWHEANNCQRMFWRWVDGKKGSKVEVRDLSSKSKWLSQGLTVAHINGKKLSTGALYKPFNKGQRPDLKLGGSRKTMDALVSGSRPLSSMHPFELVLRPDGRFMAGTLRASSLSGGKTRGPVQGQYYFDGHAATFLLDSGQVVYGFVGWLPYKDEKTLSFRSVLNINGWIYTSYCRDSVKNCD